MSDVNVTQSRLDAFRRGIDALMLEMYAIDWQDAVGDIEPLERAIEMGETPEEFVRWFGEKYDLCLKANW